MAGTRQRVPTARKGPLDIYVRVSRVAGRGGDSFISPEQQEKSIRQWLKTHKTPADKVFVELNESGADSGRPLLNEAVQRCQDGKSAGIIVMRLDRLARTPSVLTKVLNDLDKAKARLVVVDGSRDSAKSDFMLNILIAVASNELDRYRANWDAAAEHAVERGVHISRYTPVGYQRHKQTKRLLLDKRAAPVIRRAFELRVGGASWTAICRYLDDTRVRPATGSEAWTRSTVMGVIRNRVYLGEARGGDKKLGQFINPDAHPPIVDAALFDAAQTARGLPSSRKDGSVASKAMLGSLVKCAGCGSTLIITGYTNKITGERLPHYYCRGRNATGLCPARASATAVVLDRYVERMFLAALSDQRIVATATVANDELEDARRQLANAEANLANYLANTDLAEGLPPEAFATAAKQRQ